MSNLLNYHYINQYQTHSHLTLATTHYLNNSSGSSYPTQPLLNSKPINQYSQNNPHQFPQTNYIPSVNHTHLTLLNPPPPQATWTNPANVASYTIVHQTSYHSSSLTSYTQNSMDKNGYYLTQYLDHITNHNLQPNSPTIFILSTWVPQLTPTLSSLPTPN